MALHEVPLVIGTAGHIDHGKTSLVSALTGVNLDRLSEEHRRGITIELGFTPLELPSARVVSLVDVPGHEKLIRQMVAGASGLDAVMLVVAADEGVMPQTREHLDILGLLGVPRGLIVLTKCDLVDEDMLDMVRDDVAELTAGTFLEKAPVLPVSSTTGQGLDELRVALDRFVDQAQPRDRSGALFLPVDRVFPVAGFGTVVTGTSYRGSVRRGDGVEIWPEGRPSKVRSVQVHGLTVAEADAGQRTALSLADVDRSQVRRGDVVCSAGIYRATECLDVSLRLLGTAPEPLIQWQRVRLHLGTSDVLARVAILIGREVAPGETAPVQLVLEEPVAASAGQHYVIRFYSPLRTIGGGQVLNPYGRKPGNRRAREQMARDLLFLQAATDRSDRLRRIVTLAGRIDLPELTMRCQERPSDLRPLLEVLDRAGDLAVVSSGAVTVLSNERFDSETERVRTALKAFHAEFPHQPGQLTDELLAGLFTEGDRRLGRALIDRLVLGRRLKLNDGRVSLPSFVAADNKTFERDRSALLGACRSAGYQFLSIDEMRATLKMDVQSLTLLLDQLKKSGDLAILDGTFVLSRELLEDVVARLADHEGGVSLADVRGITGSSRKFMVPLMEYLDGLGITRRVGDKRIVLRRSGGAR